MGRRQNNKGKRISFISVPSLFLSGSEMRVTRAERPVGRLQNPNLVSSPGVGRQKDCSIIFSQSVSL